MSPLDEVVPENDAAHGRKIGLVEKVAGRAAEDAGGESEQFDIQSLVEMSPPQCLVEFEFSQLLNARNLGSFEQESLGKPTQREWPFYS